MVVDSFWLDKPLEISLQSWVVSIYKLGWDKRRKIIFIRIKVFLVFEYLLISIYFLKGRLRYWKILHRSKWSRSSSSGGPYFRLPCRDRQQFLTLEYSWETFPLYTPSPRRFSGLSSGHSPPSLWSTRARQHLTYNKLYLELKSGSIYFDLLDLKAKDNGRGWKQIPDHLIHGWNSFMLYLTKGELWSELGYNKKKKKKE